jgi:PST family polysaccharide transporter
MAKQERTYAQILKSSSIVGGAQVINYLIGMLRTKVVAVLLGPSGVGLVGLYVSATELVGTVTGLGIASSGVRNVVEANSTGDTEKIASTIKTLRRVCWFTGILGWLLTAALSYPLSRWAFGAGDRALSIAVLGATLLFSAVAGGQKALIQGTRRIGDLARLSVFGAIASTFVAAALYAWLGDKGIVPVLLCTAALNLGASWWFARRIPTMPIPQKWAETFKSSKRLVSIVLAFMYGSLLAALVGLAIRGIIVRQLGLDANGIYQAAWGLSGMFGSFILNAMGADFYPRLTAVAEDDAQVNRLVNEQIEVGVLLALPGLLATLALAPWLMTVFYSAKFVEGAQLLPWFVLGVFFQVVSWPWGMIQMAKGATKWMYFGRTSGNLMLFVFSVLMIPKCGLLGLSWAFSLFALLHGAIAAFAAYRLARYNVFCGPRQLFSLSFLLVGIAFVSQTQMKGTWALIVGVVVTMIGSLISLRGICRRLGFQHRIVVFALRIPGIWRILGSNCDTKLKDTTNNDEEQ